MTKPSFLYLCNVVFDDCTIRKIGITSDWKARSRNLKQESKAKDIVLLDIKCIDDCKQAEQNLINEWTKQGWRLPKDHPRQFSVNETFSCDAPVFLPDFEEIEPPINSGKVVRLISIPNELFMKISELAKLELRSRNNMIVVVLEDFFKNAKRAGGSHD